MKDCVLVNTDLSPGLKAYNNIPRYALGETPDDIPSHKYRLTIIKRALEAGAGARLREARPAGIHILHHGKWDS